MSGKKEGSSGKGSRALFQSPSTVLPREKNPGERRGPRGVREPSACRSHYGPTMHLLHVCYRLLYVPVSPLNLLCICFVSTLYLFCICHESPLCIHVSAVCQILLQTRIHRIFGSRLLAALKPPSCRLVKPWQGGCERGGCRDLLWRAGSTEQGRGLTPACSQPPAASRDAEGAAARGTAADRPGADAECLAQAEPGWGCLAQSLGS